MLLSTSHLGCKQDLELILTEMFGEKKNDNLYMWQEL